MASLYKLNAEFMACEIISDDEVVNTQTGEVLNIEYLNNLKMEYDEKLETCALYIKNLRNDIAAYKAEKERLTNAIEIMEKKEERMKQYIADNMPERKPFSTARCTISFRRSEALEVVKDFDLSQLPEEAIRTKKEVNKDALKELIKSGKTYNGASIETRNNVQIK